MVQEVPHVPQALRDLCSKLVAAGHQAWVVGGGLRDAIIGREPGDWDVATSARPEEMKKVFPRVIPTGIAHGTVTVLHAGSQFEVTTFRGEGAYTDGRRPDSVTFVGTIDEDLARRDFTVNAMAWDPRTGELRDPFGGRADADAKILRAVGDAGERFSEDGLRALRACRFAATLAFEIEPETFAAIPGAMDTFRKVSHERVRDEWVKALGAPRPAPAFRAMLGSGLLAEICPELAAGAGCEQNKWHAYDVFDHTMACLDACRSPDVVLRLAVVLHDVGKPAARKKDPAKDDWTFHGHEIVGGEIADRWMSEYRWSNDERVRVVHLIREHVFRYEPEWSDSAVRRFVRRVGPAHLEDLFLLHEADVGGKGMECDSLQILALLRERISAIGATDAALTTKALAVDGKDVMRELQIAPSRRVGEVLEALLEIVVEDPAQNDRELLVARIRAMR